MASRGVVFVDALLVNASDGEGIALQVEELSAIRLGDSRITDQHGVYTPIRWASCNVAENDATGFVA